jgi:hypothetical protein
VRLGDKLSAPLSMLAISMLAEPLCVLRRNAVVEVAERKVLVTESVLAVLVEETELEELELEVPVVRAVLVVKAVLVVLMVLVVLAVLVVLVVLVVKELELDPEIPVVPMPKSLGFNKALDEIDIPTMAPLAFLMTTEDKVGKGGTAGSAGAVARTSGADTLTSGTSAEIGEGTEGAGMLEAGVKEV